MGPERKTHLLRKVHLKKPLSAGPVSELEQPKPSDLPRDTAANASPLQRSDSGAPRCWHSSILAPVALPEATACLAPRATQTRVVPVDRR
ncbi:hypothetical protein VNO78_05631 [Psophocarpus tetragonolobus]|uniref:Uncharacterized protein n=1 Tax=Psophocarpus tetragonolobus TaxID=3891 RepID=A0AAN9XRL3_PSOTE